jgi:hypothetical protein
LESDELTTGLKDIKISETLISNNFIDDGEGLHKLDVDYIEKGEEEKGITNFNLMSHENDIIDIEEATRVLTEDLKRLNKVLSKQKEYGKATAETFVHLDIRRLYQIVEHNEELMLRFVTENILAANPQRKERCISCLEDLCSEKIENNEELMELINNTRRERILSPHTGKKI